MSRGARQGCPLSPLIFVLFLEPLVEAIRKHRDISGTNIGSEEHKLTLFADDMVLYITNPERSLHTLFSLMKEFGTVSGYLVNQVKTEIYPVCISDSLREVITQTYKLSWVTKTWRHLGVWIPIKLAEIFSANYDSLWKRVKSLLSNWSNKYLN